MGIRELRLDPALPLRRLLGAQFADEEPRPANIAKQAVVRFLAPGQREDTPLVAQQVTQIRIALTDQALAR